MNQALMAVLMATAATVSLAAQEIGDSVRLRVTPSAEWMYGRLVTYDSTGLVVRQFPSDRTYPRTAIVRMDAWRRKDPATTLLLSTLACAAGVATAVALRPEDRGPITGSDAGDIAAGAGVGLLVGLIELQISPGRWRQVRLAVR